MKTLKFMIYTLILSTASSIAVADALNTADVEKMNSLWSDNYDQGNTDILMTLYTNNATVFPPSSEILEGKDAIAGYLNDLRKAGFNEYNISNVNLDVKGDTAYSTALWEATRVGANGKSIVLEGNITNVLEKQENGSWKIKYQSWN